MSFYLLFLLSKFCPKIFSAAPPKSRGFKNLRQAQIFEIDAVVFFYTVAWLHTLLCLVIITPRIFPQGSDATRDPHEQARIRAPSFPRGSRAPPDLFPAEICY